MTNITEDLGAAPVLTLVAQNGGVSLFVDESGKAWLEIDGLEAIPVVRDGQQIDLARPGGWSLGAIGRDAQGQIRVLDINPASQESYGWVLDENGTYGGETIFGRHNADEGEGIFGKDLDGDGIILSGALELVAENDGLALFVDSGSGFAYYRDGNGGLVPILRDGANDTHLVRGDWSLAAIGRDADGNIRVLDHNPATDTSWGWIIGKDGKFGGETQYGNGGNGEAEKIFQKDLNGDGEVPEPGPRTVDVNGNLKLLVDRDTDLTTILLENGQELAITRGADGVPAVRGDYALGAIGRDDEGRLRVLDAPNGNGDHYAWILDEQGRFVGEEVFTPDGLKFAERLFNKDLDGDGELFGAPLTIIENEGSATLLKSEYSGTAYIAIGDDSVAVTRDGIGNVDVTRGAWNLVAATVDGEGRTRVLDVSADSDELFAWILDGNGHFVGEEIFQRANIGDAESLFAIDLDGDGVIGRHETASHDSWIQAA